jgi:hypothetical protein
MRRESPMHRPNNAAATAKMAWHPHCSGLPHALISALTGQRRVDARGSGDMDRVGARHDGGQTRLTSVAEGAYEEGRGMIAAMWVWRPACGPRCLRALPSGRSSRRPPRQVLGGRGRSIEGVGPHDSRGV